MVGVVVVIMLLDVVRIFAFDHLIACQLTSSVKIYLSFMLISQWRGPRTSTLTAHDQIYITYIEVFIV